MRSQRRRMKLLVRIKGSAYSGNYDHKGREGFVGGSSARGSGSAIPMPEGTYRTWQNSKEVFGKDALLDSRSMRLKGEVAKSLESVLPCEQASTFIHQWAESSNDSDYKSLSIQEDAATEFGTDLSDWQKGKLQQYHDHMAAAREIEGLNAEYMRLKKAVEKPKLPLLDTVEGVTQRDLQDYDEGLATYEEIMDRHPGSTTAAYKRYRKNSDKYMEVKEKIERLNMQLNDSPYAMAHEYSSTGYRVTYSRESGRLQSPEVQRQLLRQMYDNTQRFFKNQGITEVVMYRGVRLPVGKRPKLGNVVRVKGNAMESWSGDPDTSKNFGTVMLAMKIPVERILSIPMSGFGCLHEYEYVILGGVEDECRVVRSGW